MGVWNAAAELFIYDFVGNLELYADFLALFHIFYFIFQFFKHLYVIMILVLPIEFDQHITSVIIISLWFWLILRRSSFFYLCFMDPYLLYICFLFYTISAHWFLCYPYKFLIFFVKLHLDNCIVQIIIMTSNHLLEFYHPKRKHAENVVCFVSFYIYLQVEWYFFLDFFLFRLRFFSFRWRFVASFYDMPLYNLHWEIEL